MGCSSSARSLISSWPVMISSPRLPHHSGQRLPASESPGTRATAHNFRSIKQFATIGWLTSINSTSAQGSTNITLQFDLSRNIDAAAQDAQAMIAKAARQLPPDARAPPSLSVGEPGDQPSDVPGPASRRRCPPGGQQRACGDDHRPAESRWSVAWLRCSIRAPRDTPCAPT